MIATVHNRLVSRRRWLLILLTLTFLTGQSLAAVQPAFNPVSTPVDRVMAGCGTACEHHDMDSSDCESICALNAGCSPQIRGNTDLLLSRGGMVPVEYRRSYPSGYAEPIEHPPKQVRS